jgi:hypothetical protein
MERTLLNIPAGHAPIFNVLMAMLSLSASRSKPGTTIVTTIEDHRSATLIFTAESSP